MGVKHPYQIIDPPNLLKAKVGGELEYDQVLVDKAEAALAELSEEYTAWLEGDIAELTRLLEKMTSDPAVARPHLEAMARLVHEIRGQAGTFGYPLVTTLADSLFNLLDGVDEPGTQQFELIVTHVEAIKVVRRENIRGDGGTLGRELVAGVKKAVERAVAEH